MINQIRADLFRIFKGKGIYIVLFITILMFSVSVYMLSPGFIGFSYGFDTQYEVSPEESRYINDLSMSDKREYLLENKQFDLDSQVMGANINLYYVFIVIVSVVLCSDFSNDTIKNAISITLSKKKYFLSKTILSLLLCTFIIIINNYGSHFLNLLINGSKFTASLATVTKLTLYQLPILYGVISLILLIGFVCKKKSLFNGITIPLIIAIQSILTFSGMFFKNDFAYYLKYDIQTILYLLAQSPATEYIVKSIVLGAVYVVIFNVVGYISFKKSDI